MVKEQYICRYLEVYSDMIDRMARMARKTEKNPDAFLRKTMDMIRRGRGSFVFMNTDVGTKAMAKVYHQPIAPHMLGSQGCYNFNVKGFPQHANQTRINLPKAIELAFFEGVASSQHRHADG